MIKTHLYHTPLLVSNSNNESAQFAYVWYATDNEYLCSALVALHLLQLWRNSAKFKVDYVLMIIQGDFRRLKQQKLINRWIEKGIANPFLKNVNFLCHFEQYHKMSSN